MILLAMIVVGGLTACDGGSDKPKVVVCVPVYGQSLAMGESLAGAFGKDTMVCVFADGRGGTAISHLTKGSDPYDALIMDIQKSYKEAKERGMEFFVPAGVRTESGHERRIGIGD